MDTIIVAGTDTGIGKTICSALLMSVLKGTYFKPIQSGSKEDNDTLTVKQLSELDDEHFLKEKYLLKEPLSPHIAAEIDKILINEEDLTLPNEVAFKPLIVELAGGLMVPVNRQKLMIDVIKNWNAKVILCARTGLGTINHALLSIEALKARNIDIMGIVFIGEENIDNKKTIIEFSGVKKLGSIPKLEKINRVSLIDTFYDNFDVNCFNQWLQVSCHCEEKT
jgi:dethiobiotin synthase